MNRKPWNKRIIIPLGLLLIATGILFIIEPASQLQLMFRLLTLALAIAGVALLAKSIHDTHTQGKLSPQFGPALIDLVAAIALLWLKPATLAQTLPTLTACWVTGSGLMKIILSFQYKRSDIAYWWITLLVGILYLNFGALTILNTFTSTLMVGLALGALFISTGITRIAEALFPADGPRGGIFRQHFLIGRAFSPNATLKLLRKLMENSSLNPSTPAPSDCQITVHLADSRFEIIFGHVDMSVGGLVYSFGNYDSTRTKLFGAISDGVLVVAPQNQYIDYALKHEKKILVSYQIKLTPEQMHQMNEHLGSFIQNCTPFTPAFLDKAPNDTKDEASILTYYTDAKCYKPNMRSFKTYFVIGTNCVRFVDEAIARAGKARHHVSGVLMPGDYLSMLERELKKQNGFVTSRSIYAENISTDGDTVNVNL